MICTIDELEAWCETLAQSEGDDLRLRRGGLSDSDQRRLQRSVPGLPDSYLELASKYQLMGFELCWTRMHPGIADPGATLVEDLEAATNEELWPVAEVFGRFGVRQVASMEADPLCVVREGRGLPEIVWINHEAPDLTPLRIAQSMEQLLVIAANLLQLAFSVDDGNSDAAAMAELDNRLASLNLDSQCRANWQYLAPALIL